MYNYIELDIFAVRGRMTAMYFGRIADSLNFRGGSARMTNAGLKYKKIKKKSSP